VDFLDLIPKSLATKAKPDKWDCIKLEASTQQRKQWNIKATYEWKKIFANHLLDKELS
jgi:hypothetical protein